MSAQLIVTLVVGIVVFLIVSIPSILSRNGANAQSGFGNNDITNYANTARFLKDFTRSETGGFLGQIDLFKRLSDEGVFGAFLATAAPSSLFSLDTYQLQDISLRVFFLFSILLCYALAKEAFGYGHYPAVVVAVLYGLNSVMYYTLYQGFEAQIIATGLTLFFIVIQIHAINNSEKKSDYFPYIVFAVLLNWGISISYPHMLPFVYVPVIGYVVLVSFHGRSWKPAINWGAFALATIALTFMLSPSRGQSLVTYLLVMNKVEAGWHIGWLFPEAFFGFTFKHWYLQPPHSDWIRLAIIIPVLTLIVTGLVVAYKKDRRLFILAVVSVLPILAGYFLLARPGPAKAEWGGYKSYKLLSFFLPLVMAASLILFRNLRFNRESRVAFVLPVLLAMLVGCNLLSAGATVRAMMIRQRPVREAIAALKEIESNSLVDSINITTADIWDNMWYAHFLMRKQLYYKNSIYYPASSLIGHWTLKEGIEDLDILHVDGFETPPAAGQAAQANTVGINTIPVGSKFVLERAGAPRPIVEARLDAGWHGSEGTHIWTGGDSNVSTIMVTSPDRLVINFRLRYWPLNPNNRLSIYLNSTRITDCPDGNHCETDEITLAKGQNVLELRAMLQPEVPGNGDQRRLGFAVQSIDISPSRSVTTAPKAAAAGK